MDTKKRELFFRVIDGDSRLIEIMFHFDRFTHCERMLEWLIQNKITGKTFFDLYLNTFKASWLSMGKWVVMRVNKDKELKPVYAGKDFRVK
jgi:hypothetical protein